MKKRSVLIGILLLFLIPFVFADDSTLSGSFGFDLTVQGGIVCERVSSTVSQWKDYSQSPVKVKNATGSNANCYYPDGTDLEGNSNPNCCPLGYRCEYQLNSVDFDLTVPKFYLRPVYRCVYIAKTFCDQFNANESDCTGNGTGNIIVANNTLYTINGTICGRDPSAWIIGNPPNDLTCQNYTKCACVWNASASKCNALYNKTRNCYNNNNPTLPPVITDEEGCEWATTLWEDHCLDGGGYILAEYTGTPRGSGIPPANCNGAPLQKRLDCSSIAMMGFFDENMLIISLIAVAIIYTLYLIYSKKKK